jgi:O-antigen/teichoic acid export membrane protein
MVERMLADFDVAHGLKSIALRYFNAARQGEHLRAVERVFALLHSRTSFFSNVTVLVGGQSLAMAIPVFTAPVLGRLYSPRDYGLLGAYMSIAVVVSTIGNWQYAQAIVLESRDARAWALVRVCVWTSLVTAAVSLFVPLVVMALPLESNRLLEIKVWLWLLPVSAFISGVTGCFTALANRFTRYTMMASIQIGVAFATAAASIVFGFLKWGASGLLTAYFLSQLLIFMAYGHFFRIIASHASFGSVAMSLALLRRHRGYALYSTPTSFIEQFAANSPIYALNLAGAPELIGLYSRARQLISMPLTPIASSVTQVFQRRAAEDMARQGHCKKTFTRTFLALAGIGLVPCLVLAFAAPWLFGLYLGPKWREAGEVARILAPMLMLQLVCSPLSSMFSIARKQKLDLLLTVAYKVVVFIAVFTPVIIGAPPIYIIVGYSIAMAGTYILYLILSSRLAINAFK